MTLALAFITKFSCSQNKEEAGLKQNIASQEKDPAKQESEQESRIHFTWLSSFVLS